MTDPEPEDPQTVGEHIRKFLADLRLAKQVEVDFADQEAINRDYERALAAEDAAAGEAGAQMAADGVPVASPESEPEPEPEPEPEAEAEAEPEPEASL